MQLRCSFMLHALSTGRIHVNSAPDDSPVRRLRPVRGSHSLFGVMHDEMLIDRTDSLLLPLIEFLRI